MIYINKSSVQYFDDEYAILAKQASGDAYSIGVSICTFDFLPGSNFDTCSPALIEELFSEDLELVMRDRKKPPFQKEPLPPLQAEGRFEDMAFANLAEKIANFFAIIPLPPDGFACEAEESPEQRANMQVFWAIVAQHFTLPPTRCIEYFPYESSYFELAAGWGCCGFLINEVRSKALFFHLSGFL